MATEQEVKEFDKKLTELQKQEAQVIINLKKLTQKERDAVKTVEVYDAKIKNLKDEHSELEKAVSNIKAQVDQKTVEIEQELRDKSISLRDDINVFTDKVNNLKTEVNKAIQEGLQTEREALIKATNDMNIAKDKVKEQLKALEESKKSLYEQTRRQEELSSIADQKAKSLDSATQRLCIERDECRAVTTEYKQKLADYKKEKDAFDVSKQQNDTRGIILNNKDVELKSLKATLESKEAELSERENLLLIKERDVSARETKVEIDERSVKARKDELDKTEKEIKYNQLRIEKLARDNKISLATVGK